MVKAEVFKHKINGGYGFRLLRDENVFQEQAYGSNSEIWTKAEAQTAADAALEYWRALEETNGVADELPA